MAIIALDKSTGRSHYSVVYLKQRWSDDWTLNANVVATSVTWAVNPDRSQATLRMRYGWRIDLPTPLVQAFGDCGGWYVKIEIVESGNNYDTVVRKWYGYIVADGSDDAGIYQVAGNFVQSGEQYMRCVGFEDFLYRSQMITSEFWFDGARRTAERGLTFNRRGSSGEVEANQTAATVPAPMFEGNLANSPEFWSSRTIVQYLLHFQTPKDFQGNKTISFEISSQDLLKIPAKDRPELRTHGNSVGDLLNQVINRYRQMTWWCEFDENSKTVKVKVARLHPDPIMLPDSSETMPGNPIQVAINTFGDPSIQVRTNSKSTQQFHQFIYQGATRRHCFNVNADQDHTIDDGWDSSQKSTFDGGGSGEPGYPGTTEPRQRVVFDRRVRSSEKVRDVYSRFQFPEDWDQQAGNGKSGSQKQAIAETPGVGQSSSQQYYIYPPDMRFCHSIPMLDNTSYQGQSASTFGMASGKKPFEEQRPVCFMPIDTDVYIDMTKLGANIDIEVEEFVKDFRWSPSISVDPSGRAMRCEIHGADQYVIADNHYAAQSHDEYRPRVDYESFIWLVGVYDDRRCEGRYPADKDLPTTYPNADVILRYVVYLGDEYKQDDVLSKTHVSAEPATGTLQESFGGYVRDDSGKLEDMARMAFEWYATPRRSITLESTNDNQNIALGVFVTEWQLDSQANVTRPINSIITQISREFPISKGGRPPVSKMMLTTSFEQFDPVKL